MSKSLPDSNRTDAHIDDPEMLQASHSEARINTSRLIIVFPHLDCSVGMPNHNRLIFQKRFNLFSRLPFWTHYANYLVSDYIYRQIESEDNSYLTKRRILSGIV